MLSCYIIAHQEKWKSIYKERKATAAVSAETSEEPNVVIKRGRRSLKISIALIKCHQVYRVDCSCIKFSYEDYLNFDHLFVILVYF